jgi:hypothetical protein
MIPWGALISALPFCRSPPNSVFIMNVHDHAICDNAITCTAPVLSLAQV